jgi:mannose-1-phosphate guanylyltransferase/mannose-6-phosphate isomerase
LTQIVPVIMSGGAGTRLWPLSTEAKPKQFHALGSALTMLQETGLRLCDDAGLAFAPPVIICSMRHLDEVASQLQAVSIIPSAIVLEPLARNTAAVAAIAAQIVADQFPGALALLLPADHVIQNPAAFRAVIGRAAATARKRIVTFGIEPDRPETGFGYIQRGEALDDGVFKVSRFTEKPPLALAQHYLDEGGYDWNAGIFLFAPTVMLAEMNAHRPDILKAALSALSAASREGVVIYLDHDLFAKTPSESIDVAVMEATALAAVAPCSVGWADIGSWSELWRMGPFDGAGNVTRGEVFAIDTRDSYLHADDMTIAVVGVSDLVVVASQGAVIVLPKSRSQEVKALLAGVKALRVADKP